MAWGAGATGNGQAPPCDHIDTIRPVSPHGDGCAECLARGDGWEALRLCLSCGWVACSDESKHQHARAHYEETDHPVVATLEPGSGWMWCYVHQRVV